MRKAFRSIRVVTIGALAVLLALASAQQGSYPVQAAGTDSDGDTFIDMAEEINGSNPFDAASTPEDTGTAFVLSVPLCSDGVDNDLDGLTDGDDPGCVDSDGDIVSDPMETLLGSDPFDAGSFPEDSRLDIAVAPLDIPPFCGDGIDNDLDGLTDGDDPGCTPVDTDGDGFDDVNEKAFGSDPSDSASTPEHENPHPGSCGDGVDNDLDGLTDGADFGCQAAANDSRADATEIVMLPFTDSAKVFDTTTEPGEPEPTCAQRAGIASTVWYSFTPAEDILVVVDTLESNYDTLIGVWTESSSGLAQVACNDDFIGTDTGSETLAGSPGTIIQARLAFRGAAGQTYLIQVGRFGRNEGDFNLNSRLTFRLDVGVPVANDDLTGATTISALPFTDSPLDISNATRGPDEPTTGCAFGGVIGTVWYKFIPAEDMRVIVDTRGSDFDRVLAVWTESAFGFLEMDCDNSFGEIGQTRQIAFQAARGQTYFFQVSQIGAFGPRGWSLVFNLAGEPASAVQRGDVNCDGSVNAVDAALVLQFSAGLLASVPCAEGADVNGDGGITSVDAALILQFTAGLFASLPL